MRYGCNENYFCLAFILTLLIPLEFRYGSQAVAAQACCTAATFGNQGRSLVLAIQYITLSQRRRYLGSRVPTAARHGDEATATEGIAAE